MEINEGKTASYARARQPIPVSGSYDLSSSLESDKLWSWLLDFILASLLRRRSAPCVKAGRSACAPRAANSVVFDFEPTSVHVTTLRRHAARAEKDEGGQQDGVEKARTRRSSPCVSLSLPLPTPYRRSWASLQSELLPLGTSAHSRVTDARSQTLFELCF